jgi:L-fucose isomerase-like protein
VPGLGTVFHPIARSRFPEELAKVEATDEVRAIADFYAKHAAKIVEPTPPEILDAARNYVACRRLMDAERCHGITIACLGWKNPVCLAFSKLLDEGIVAGCEADLDAALSLQLLHLLFERSGFIQDPSPNTVNNTLIGAHCTSPTKLEGFHQPYRAPYQLRSYHTRTGVSMQVLWPVGKPVTVMKFQGGGTMLVGSGRVVANIPQPPSGCCRTAVEIELEGVADSLDTKGFHQLFVLGELERPLRAWCKLAGVNAVHI